MAFDLLLRNTETGSTTAIKNGSIKLILKAIKDFTPKTEQVGVTSGKRTKLKDNESEEIRLLQKLDEVLNEKKEEE